MKYSKSGTSFFHFIVECCAIIGGVFTLAGLTDFLLLKIFGKF